MTCHEIIKKLEVLAPAFYAEEWDNVGLLAGRRDKEVKRIYVALDATEDVIDLAILTGADMLVTHHPLIFKPLKKINSDDFVSRRILSLIQNDISYYVMHTNFDVTHMADIAADYLDLGVRSVLDVTYEDESSRLGIGKVGILKERMTLSECCELVKERFELRHVKVFGDMNASIETVAISPGSGKSVIEAALKAGVEALITGDIGHHEGIDAKEQGLSIIDAGHYGLEHIFIPYILDYLQRECKELQCIGEKIQNPFRIV